ncbi:MAG: 50S ribosomal protein L29 [Spirochaetaceae bacterium]|jgi:large subunit ribosomal protein L29|nr:50S ribosomal protein L29 [Spirochaetaceae bacterium]
MKNSFKNLTFPELKVKRDEFNKKYLELRFQLVVGHVDNPLQKRTMRRQIARLNTLIAQHEADATKKLLATGAKVKE